MMPLTPSEVSASSMTSQLQLPLCDLKLLEYWLAYWMNINLQELIDVLPCNSLSIFTYY